MPSGGGSSAGGGVFGIALKSATVARRERRGLCERNLGKRARYCVRARGRERIGFSPLVVEAIRKGGNS